jgi:hypothetical protein
VLQGWLGIKDTVLHSGEGAIQCVRWSSTLIAWTNAVSTKARATLQRNLVVTITSDGIIDATGRPRRPCPIPTAAACKNLV